METGVPLHNGTEASVENTTRQTGQEGVASPNLKRDIDCNIKNDSGTSDKDRIEITSSGVLNAIRASTSLTWTDTLSITMDMKAVLD